MVTMTLTAPSEPAIPVEPPVVDHVEEVAPHHTSERQQQIAEMAARPIRWQEDAFRWIEGNEGAIDAFRRLLLRMDRYHDALRAKKLVRSDANFGSTVDGLAALAHHHRRWIRPLEDWTSAVERGGKPQRIDQFSLNYS